MDSNTFSALSQPSRFQIVELLRNGPRPVGEISLRLKLNQPQTSKHLRVLADAGIVDVKPLAQQRIYGLSPKRFAQLDNWISSYRRIMELRFYRLDKLLSKEKNKLKGGVK